MKKQVLVSVDRGETRVALLEAAISLKAKRANPDKAIAYALHPKSEFDRVPA